MLPSSSGLTLTVVRFLRMADERKPRLQPLQETKAAAGMNPSTMYKKTPPGKRKPTIASSTGSQDISAKHTPMTPTTPVTQSSSSVKEPSSTTGDASNGSASFTDVPLNNEAEDHDCDDDFELVQHADALHSSYNSQADHKWKYNDAANQNLLQEAKSEVAKADDGFEQLTKDRNGTSSRNGAADRPENYL